MLYIELAAGLILLLLGGDLLVRGAVSLAQRLGLSPLLIGLTIVGFGTSAPEMLTSVQAALAGAPGIAVGNVVGSNIANILLILGLAALLSPIVVARDTFLRDGTVLALSTIGVALLALGGTLTPLIGAGLLAALAAYLVFAWRADRTAPAIESDLATPQWPRAAPLAVAVTLGGLVLTVLGASLLVSSAVELARGWQVSDSLIGLTVVAVGTSLPELATSVVAALRRQGAVAFGNVIGSNIFNLLGILGVTALVRTVPIPPEILTRDIWVMLGATALLVVVAVTGWRVTRTEGAVLMLLYAAYIGAMALL
ncbi:calcium/sodium antiporter [Lacimonas salitolerans]|uniref:Calcium/sodium antiporter n=1 Tax=Lacimonas salitolerans TaxID=1323750 RepID=A0ABW4EEF0_9RHOB